MKLCAVSLLFLSLLLCTASAHDFKKVVTRYGEVKVSEAPPDKYDIMWGKRQLTSIEAMWIDLYRVSPQGKNEYVVIDSRVPGLNCLHVFRVLVLTRSGRHFLSEKFGECTELKAIHHTSTGVRVETAGSVRSEKHRYLVSERAVVESE
jgi:hypothetical protein